MKAEIIAVWNRDFDRTDCNTNAQFLSEKLAEIGVDVYFQTAVGDNEARLLSLLEIASQRSSLVILTGGLGPTEDDLTKQTLAKFLGKELVSIFRLRRSWMSFLPSDQTMPEHRITKDKLNL